MTKSLTQDSAFRKFLSSFDAKILSVQDFNKGRHKFIKTDSGNYYLVYKRDFFLTFGKQFPDFMSNNPDLSGIGESLNKSSFKKCLELEVDFIVFLHPYTFYYLENYKKVLSDCLIDELVRVQDKTNEYKQEGGSYSPENEETISFPKEWLKVWKSDG